MTEDANWIDDIATPALLRGARSTYGSAIRGALSAAGYDDVPRNGIYLIGGLARGGAPLSQIIRELRVSKQAAGQLVDTLVLRGYLDRTVDSEDRRRLTVTLTERGRAAAAASQEAIGTIDVELRKRVSAEFITHMRATLAVLCQFSGTNGIDGD